MAEALLPSDLSAIQAERGPVHMHVGAVLVADGSVSREAVVERIRNRIHLIPRYRMRLDDVAPLGLAYPVWEDDGDFDAARHVRRVGLPAPGGDAELCELVGDLMSERLDRVFALARTSLEGVKAVRGATGATVNDVLLTAVALMLSEYLGADRPASVVALVPVSVRTEAERGELGNRISTVFVDLPLAGDPSQRLEAISDAMTAIKASGQVRAGALIVGATGLALPLVSSLAVAAMSGPRLFNLVVSNVPGPQQTFYLAGVPVRDVFPVVPLNPRNQGLSVGILSYDGGVYFGLLADRDALPDVVDAATGIERALGELRAA